MPAIKTYLPALIGAVATLTVGIFALFGDFVVSEGSRDLELIEVLYARVESLEAKYEEVIKENRKQAATIQKLRVALAKKYDASDTLRDYLDGIPYPAWVKVVEEAGGEPVFRMWHINRRYEDVFGVRAGHYVGKTDYDVWGSILGNQYYKNDLAVFLRSDSKCLLEDVRIAFEDGVTREEKSCKWKGYVDGMPAVSGMIISDG